MTLSFDVKEHEDGWLLRDVLRARLVSASLLTQLKNTDGIRVDGAALRANERVHTGAHIVLALPPERDTSVTAQRIPVTIAYESAHAAVLEKPAGMAVHPTLGYHDGTLGNAWMGVLETRGEEGVFRPVNRIDRNTSGLVLCAKNTWAASVLARDVRKVYLAIVEGELPLGDAVIDAPIARCADSIIRRCVDESGKPSRTEYTVLASSGGCSLAACNPVTGRTHQIRVHFSHIGHPLAGDDLYGGSREFIGRHALHCAQIAFPDPETGRTVRVQSALPPDMLSVCRRCGWDNKEFSHL